MAELGRAAVLGATLDAGTARLRFAAAEGVRERLESIAEAERRCCPFLTLRVSETPGEVVLRIDAPPEAQPLLEQIVAAFTPPGSAPTARAAAR